MSLTEELAEAAVVAVGGFVFARDGWEFRAEDQKRPDYCDDTEDEVGPDHAQNFKLKVSLVRVIRLAGGDLRRGQLDTGKDKNCADQCAGHGAEGIEGLREIQAALGCVRIAELGDEWIGSRFKKGKPTGNDEECEKEKGIAAL